MSETLRRSRETAYYAQHGRCYYCDGPMWLFVPQELTEPFDASVGLVANLRCTAEHLVPQSEGGGDGNRNIVAACQLCNGTRHKRKSPPSPERYREEVRRRVAAGRWHPGAVRRLLDLVRHSDA